MRHRSFPGFVVAAAVLLTSACSDGGLPLTQSPDFAPIPDLNQPEVIFGPYDMEGPCPNGDPDDGGATCGTRCTPDCPAQCLGPAYNLPFPLRSDPVPDPRETDTGLFADPDGNLLLDSINVVSFNYSWAPNSTDWQRGTISKLDTLKVREVARYYTVTCSSLKTGSKLACDGTNGCCAADDADRYAARLAGKADPGHQSVQLTNNRPSRTGIDFNGAILVANRAPMGQASVTRIAGNPSDCIDRNKNKRIDTSSDVNGDGRIETDCNGDGLPDDMDGVKVRACLNGMKQEFYGLDDECVLWTSNVDAQGQEGRALGLMPGDKNSAVSDVVAVTLPGSTVTRLNGSTGTFVGTAQLPMPCQPNGVTVDANGIMWAVGAGQTPLCYYDTQTGAVGQARDSKVGAAVGYGLTMDRDQNVWISGGTNSPEAYRYTPDRTKGLANLGSGFWLTVHKLGAAGGASGPAKGMTADSRNAKQYFAWVAIEDGHVAQLPASTYPQAKLDQELDGSALPVIDVRPYQLVTATVDQNQNVWAVSAAPSAMIRISVDKNGVVTPPDLLAPPKGMDACPAGDRCALKDNNASEPGVDGYSSLSDFGLRIGGIRGYGNYDYVFSGCHTKAGVPLPTWWTSLSWDALVPPNTTLTGRVRDGNTATPDGSWSAWTNESSFEPVDLTLPDMNVPALLPAPYLQVELVMRAGARAVTTTLKGVCVQSRCASPQ